MEYHHPGVGSIVQQHGGYNVIYGYVNRKGIEIFQVIGITAGDGDGRGVSCSSTLDVECMRLDSKQTVGNDSTQEWRIMHRKIVHTLYLHLTIRQYTKVGNHCAQRGMHTTMSGTPLNGEARFRVVKKNNHVNTS